MINPKFLPLIAAFFLFSCSGGEEENQTEQAEEQTEEVAEVSTSEITGFETIEDLTGSFLQSISARDYEGYLTHVINTEMENNLASRIEREDKRSDFIKEYGFSMKNEQESFNDIVNYLDDKGLDPMSAAHDQLEIIDYEHDHYAPLDIKEVIIPFPYESYEIDIIVTAVNYEGSWYLTSEISL